MIDTFRTTNCPTASILLALRSPSKGAAPHGFTLVEVVVAGVLMALIVGGAATTLMVGQRSSGRQGAQAQLESLIDQDLAEIQVLDRAFTCCTGNPCTSDADAISEASVSPSGSCLDSNGSPVSPGNENYYAPRQSSTSVTAPDTVEFGRFRAACGNGGIAQAFTTELAALPAPVPATPVGLSRAVDITDRDANRITLTYTGTNAGATVTTRIVNLIPTAAAWCP